MATRVGGEATRRKDETARSVGEKMPCANRRCVAWDGRESYSSSRVLCMLVAPEACSYCTVLQKNKPTIVEAVQVSCRLKQNPGIKPIYT
jgi:hypothetical protein